MPFQNDIQKQNISLELDYLFTKYPMFFLKRGEDICMARYVLIRRNFLYDSALHDLVFLPVYSKPTHR